MRQIKIYALMLLVFFSIYPQVLAEQPAAGKQEDYFDMSLEELMDVEVTLSSKKPEKLSETPAAIYVITAEDIRRSGHTSIPELLRMVPGINVARINSHTWAVSSRGFNMEFANKMLVMIDGRSIYNIFYGGVYWDMHDVMLEDVERIEVIRGPGGTIWGANAVNGIINIITKNAKDTQGTLITGGGGTEELGFGAIRYGGKLSEDTWFRVYSKYFSRDDGPVEGGSESFDEWDVFRGGFRINAEPTQNDHWTLQGDIYDGDVGVSDILSYLTSPYSDTIQMKAGVSGGNLLGRWKHIFADGSDMSLQIYYDQNKRHTRSYTNITDTVDFDFYHHFSLTDNHEITSGLGYRLIMDELRGSFGVTMGQSKRDMHTISWFAQDDITLVEDKLKATVGAKMEHNSFTGLEIQPSARLLWTPNEKETIWAAATHAVRTPTRSDSDMVINYRAGPIWRGIHGNDDIESETVDTFELGYRVKPNDKLLLDIAAFFNNYDDLIAQRTISPINMGTYTVYPTQAINGLDGESYGGEVSAIYKVNDNWKLNAGYSFIQMQMHRDDSSATTNGSSTEGDTPHNQFHIRSYLNLTKDLELDLLLNYVDNVPAGNVHNYIRFDARLGWHITEDLELSLVGQNLLESRHPEFYTMATTATEAQRAFYAKLTYRF